MCAAQVPVDSRHDPHRDNTFAWLSLGLYPLSTLAAFGVGEGLATALFGWDATTDPPLVEALAATVPALIVFALPAVPAWFFGMRAHRGGVRAGRIAAWLGAAVGGLFALLNATAYLVGG